MPLIPGFYVSPEDLRGVGVGHGVAADSHVEMPCPSCPCNNMTLLSWHSPHEGCSLPAGVLVLNTFQSGPFIEGKGLSFVTVVWDNIDGYDEFEAALLKTWTAPVKARLEHVAEFRRVVEDLFAKHGAPL